MRQGNATQVEIAYELSPGGVWTARTIVLPAGKVGEERVAALLPRRDDQDFWRPLANIDDKSLRDFLVRLIMNAQQDFTIMYLQHVEQTRPPPSLNHEITSIGNVRFRVSTVDGRNFRVEWKHANGERDAACTVTVEEGIIKRADIRGKLPPEMETTFWPIQEFLYNGIDIRKDAARVVTNSIVAIRKKEYGISASWR
jgi:hypothetical protein